MFRNGLSIPHVSCTESCRVFQPITAIAERSFALFECYSSRRSVSHLLKERYPFIIAHTTSCANPNASSEISVLTYIQPPVQVDVSPCFTLGSSRRYLYKSFPGCLDPYLGGACSAYNRFFLQTIGFPQVANGSALPTQSSLLTILVRRLFRDCSHSLMFRPPVLLAIQFVPTTGISEYSWAAMTFTSEQNLSRYLPKHRIY